jgi:hypothetical protein
VTSPTTLDRALPWLLRAIWVAVLVTGGAAIDGAADGRSEAWSAVATYGAGVIWLAGVVALAVPAVVTLTAARLVVPTGPVVAAAAWLAGADAVDGAAFVTLAAAATVVVLSADVGRAFVQASAYGDEDRYPLRPPPAYGLAAVVAWCAGTAALIAGPLLLAGENWFAGAPLTAVAIALPVFAWPRWHRLARRWFVIVPVGLVIHDHLVLGETLMLRRQEVSQLHLAPAGTEAADLTGPAGGHAIEIVTREPVTALRAGSPSDSRGSAIHLTACLVAPTRPGRVLASAGRRGLPVR